MSATTLKLARIGNSQGVRLPRTLRRQYGWTTEILAEERPEGLLLRRSEGGKLPLDETFKAMSKSKEDWSEWESTTADGPEPYRCESHPGNRCRRSSPASHRA